MRLESRKLLDKAFSGVGLIAIVIMALALIFILAPIIWRGSKAFIFKATVEHRKVMFEQFHHGSRETLERESAAAEKARAPIYQMLADYEESNLQKSTGIEQLIEEKDQLRDVLRDEMRALKKAEVVDEEKLDALDAQRDLLKEEIDELEEQLDALEDSLAPYTELAEALRELLGPLPGEEKPVTVQKQYGQTRWDRALVKKRTVLATQEWVSSDSSEMLVEKWVPRVEQFRGTPLEPLFDYVDTHFEEIMRPKTTFYWRFITDEPMADHFFGGIWPAVLGTIYLTLGAMIFAIPMGVIAAIYLCEYAKEGRIISFLRICISTLAGVPSIVFGLFGLAFFINTIQVSDSKSVLAGSLTLSLLILPTIIRSSEEAILAVPRSYKEAAFGLGAGRWRTVLTVILPASLPGILTGIVISMGRAAGETAPIIFTAAVSLGAPLKLAETLNQATPALPWGIYNLCTEHAKVDEIRHVQYGMALTLIAIVLLLNLLAIVLRARISKKLRG
ncbi:MAG: phosphate ABC transporter permease PstA [Pontiellaceae bacterium]|nr:phosphate ABC transporter permease PstA [Pontiellaceae bacterium]